ncbi:11348_t:CDS:2, partial [Paraglomus occultum]
MNDFEAFLQFLEENGLAVVKEKISNKTWEYVVGLDDKEDWEELGASRTDAKSIYSQIDVRIDRYKIDPSTATMSAKFLCWLKGVLVFKGEEKADEADFATAEQELRNKTSQWRPTHFANLDYIFSYAAAGQYIG